MRIQSFADPYSETSYPKLLNMEDPQPCLPQVLTWKQIWRFTVSSLFLSCFEIMMCITSFKAGVVNGNADLKQFLG